MYLLQCLQGVRVYFSDEVGFSYSIKILTNRIDIHQAVVRHLYTFEVWEKPENLENSELENDQQILCSFHESDNNPIVQYIVV